MSFGITGISIAPELGSIIPNEISQHPTMSADATMVLIYLLSCKPDWVIKPKCVWKAKNISRNHVYKAFDELIQLGYMEKVEIREGNLKRNVKYRVSYLKKQQQAEPEKPAAAVVVVFPIFDELDISRNMKRELSSKMDAQTAYKLVQCVNALKSRESDAKACNAVLGAWETWEGVLFSLRSSRGLGDVG